MGPPEIRWESIFSTRLRGSQDPLQKYPWGSPDRNAKKSLMTLNQSCSGISFVTISEHLTQSGFGALPMKEILTLMSCSLALVLPKVPTYQNHSGLVLKN